MNFLGNTLQRLLLTGTTTATVTGPTCRVYQVRICCNLYEEVRRGPSRRSERNTRTSARLAGQGIGKTQKRFASTWSAQKITQILSANEVKLDTHNNPKLEMLLPNAVGSIECNQLAANNPIEDRLRISSVHLPGCKEPTLIMGVFDGHGGGTTADLISRRLFNYIAIALHPSPGDLEISSTREDQQQQQHDNNGSTTEPRLTGNLLVDLHSSPPNQASGGNPQHNLGGIELDLLNYYKSELSAQRRKRDYDTTGHVAAATADSKSEHVAASLRDSFRRCDEDLSREIQENLRNSTSLNQEALRHYLHASVSGCCAIVMVIHEGIAYLASSGDCRAVLGVYDGGHEGAAAASTAVGPGGSPPEGATIARKQPKTSSIRALELNDEHNCDNINEVRRLTASHPRSEQNTMIKHNRLLGHLMPFRAFGDFTYKWPADLIRALGITRAFGPGVIPASYESPPYLIAEPDVRIMRLDGDKLELIGGGGAPRPPGGELVENEASQQSGGDSSSKYLVMASDGLWELFESSRDVIETIVDHSLNSYTATSEEDYDRNCATYVLRSALRSGPHQDIGMDQERMRRLYHLRLESTLTLPKSVVRNYRDDISIILIKLQ